MSELNQTKDLLQLSQLVWACRRGMLELDVLLNNFLREVYQDLTIEDKQIFTELLHCPDPLLFGWLMGKDAPDEVRFINLIKQIQHHAKSRLQRI